MHGTFLLHFDLPRIERYLRMPSREPGYRRGRRHGDFLCNLNLDPGLVKHSLRKIWGATQELEMPLPDVGALVGERYSRPEWNLKF
jgi:lipoate-protein ligase A